MNGQCSFTIRACDPSNVRNGEPFRIGSEMKDAHGKQVSCGCCRRDFLHTVGMTAGAVAGLSARAIGAETSQEKAPAPGKLPAPQKGTAEKGQKMKQVLVDYLVDFVKKMDENDWCYKKTEFTEK